MERCFENTCISKLEGYIARPMTPENPNGEEQTAETTPTMPQQLDKTEKTSLTLEMTINIVKKAIRTVLDRNRKPYVYEHRSGSKTYQPIDKNPPPAANAIQRNARLQNGTLSMNELDLVQVIFEVEDQLAEMQLLAKEETLQHLDQLPLTTTVGELAHKVFSAVTDQSLSGSVIRYTHHS